jgi:hypothetical protein
VETRILAREVGGVLRWARVLGDGRPTARLPFDVRVR